MTDQDQQVRATARVPVVPHQEEPAVLVPVRRSGQIGPVHLLQLLLAQAGLVLAVVTAAGGLVTGAIGAAGGALLVVVAFGRWDGRWWLERWLMRRQYRRRQRARPGPYPADPVQARVAALRLLAPALTVSEVPAADGSRVGVARDDAGWYAVAAVEPPPPTGDRPGGRLPVATLMEALTGAAQPGTVLQLVWHTLPAPGVDTDPEAPASQSYRHLLAGFGGPPVPMDQAIWVAVRLDAKALAEAGADRTDAAQAPSVVAALVRGIAKPLHRAGLRPRVLDAAGLVGAVARSCGLEPPAGGPVAPAPHDGTGEEWTRWRAEPLAHRSYWVQHWPPAERVAELLDGLVTPAAAATNLSVILAPTDDDRFDLRCLVRVTAPAAALDPACRQTEGRARELRAGLLPLNGEQGPALYASAPTGGGPW